MYIPEHMHEARRINVFATDYVYVRIMFAFFVVAAKTASTPPQSSRWTSKTRSKVPSPTTNSSATAGVSRECYFLACNFVNGRMWFLQQQKLCLVVVYIPAVRDVREALLKGGSEWGGRDTGFFFVKDASRSNGVFCKNLFCVLKVVCIYVCIYV